VGSKLQAAPVSGSLGLKITGIDLTEDLDDSVIAELRRLLLTRLALFFPGQSLSHAAQYAFAQRFGEVQRHPDRAEWVENTDEKIVIVSPKGRVSSVWHCDYDEDFVPCGFSMLNMIRCAADGGGDTIFASSNSIYDQFSAPMRALLDGLTAIHRNIGNSKRKRDTAEFPLVGVHPETGRKGLLYSAHHVVGFVELPQAESDILLDYLKRLTVRPDFAYRHHWEAGTLVFWDNRCIQHFAVPDFAGERMLYQVTLAGGLPIGTGQRHS
jgi:taurine dioxygenase